MKNIHKNQMGWRFRKVYKGLTYSHYSIKKAYCICYKFIFILKLKVHKRKLKISKPIKIM